MMRTQWPSLASYTLIILVLLHVSGVSDARQLFTYGSLGVERSESIATTTPVTMYVVGDVFLGRAVERLMVTYGFDYPYRFLPPAASEKDIVLANFESAVPVTHQPTPDFGFQFSVRPEAVQALHTWGVTHASLANNHSYDFGVTGYKETVTALAVAGIVPFGSREVSSSSVQFIETNGETVALVAMTTVGIEQDTTALADVVAATAELATYTLVYIHWGTEYAATSTQAQRTIAYALVDAGADAVAGHHPHVVQEIEMYNGTPIFYSLGNFIFDQYFDEAVQEGLTLAITIQPDQIEYRLQPVTSIGSRSQPRLMSAYDQSVFLTELAKHSSPELQTAIQIGVVQQSRQSGT